jgi:hypothetical protein
MKTNPRPTPQERRTARVRALSHAVSGALVAAAVAFADALSDTPVAALLAGALLLTVAVVVADPGNHLLATAAPQPPITGADLVTCVSTARISLPEHELAVAGAVGVYRVGAHSLRAVAESDTDTTAIPAVRA